QLLAVDGAVGLRDGPVLALDDDHITGLDLLPRQRATFIAGTLELRAGVVAGDLPARKRAANPTGPRRRVLLLGAIVADQPEALEPLAGLAALAMQCLLDEPPAHDPLALDGALQLGGLVFGAGPDLHGEGPVAHQRFQLLVLGPGLARLGQRLQ